MSKYTETPAASPSNMAATDTMSIVCAADYVCLSALTDDFSLVASSSPSADVYSLV